MQQRRNHWIKAAKPLPVADVLYLKPAPVRPPHYTAEDIANLPKPVENPDLTKGRFSLAFPLFIPAAFAYGFFLLNNATGFYSKRAQTFTPPSL